MKIDDKTISDLWKGRGLWEEKPARRKPSHPEAELQAACVRWFGLQHGRHHLLFHIPNGGKRNAREAARFKAEGVVPGIPDLFLAVARHGFNGLFIELKAGRNRPSPAQESCMRMLEAAGYYCTVVRTLDEFIREITDYLTTR